ncbi:MAG: dihydrodipicolinate synthase family protein [Verrucomicrobiae bacterium]|nr:dihydrodipicolinate synthase family protein [Verrucomicrobiae bacterium]
MSKTKIKIDGIVPVIPTPFTAREEIHEDDLRRLVEFAIATHASCICLPAYGSEFYKMSEAERHRVVQIAVKQSRGRIPVLAQSNHPSAKLSAEIAKKNEALGADVISFALPRQFAIPETDMVRYAERICRAVKTPVLIQDFNPGGGTVGANFCKELQARCSNFLYIKLEEPLMGPKVRAIRKATKDKLGVLEGWGGLYMTELYDFGICGLMPGTGLGDLLHAVWVALKEGRRSDAFDTFEKVMPLISFSLQSLELYHHVEKRLLKARGAMTSTRVRDAQWTPFREALEYTDELIERVLVEVDRLGMKRRPV